MVTIGGEIFDENALSESVAALEAMGDGIFVLDFDPDMALVVWVVVIIRVDYADLITEANIIFKASFAAIDNQESLIRLKVGLEASRELGSLAWFKGEIE